MHTFMLQKALCHWLQAYDFNPPIQSWELRASAGTAEVVKLD